MLMRTNKALNLLKSSHQPIGETSWRQYVESGRVIFEFNIKVPPINTSIDSDGWNIEVQDEVDNFTEWLRKRYSWVENVYITGRSGGWVAVQCYPGQSPTSLSVPHSIAKHVYAKRKAFVKRVSREYPRSQF